jgi:hypothetical protein
MTSERAPVGVPARIGGAATTCGPPKKSARSVKDGQPLIGGQDSIAGPSLPRQLLQ